MWAAIPWAGKKKGFCIIYNGNQVHSVSTYKQALAYIKTQSKIKKKTTSTLEQFL
jgi:muramidase (phage lysozyme)